MPGRKRLTQEGAPHGTLTGVDAKCHSFPLMDVTLENISPRPKVTGGPFHILWGQTDVDRPPCE